MQIEYRLSPKDYQEASQAHFKSQLWIYFVFWFFIMFGLLSLIIDFVSERQLDVFVITITIITLLVPPVLFLNPYFSNPLKNYFINLTWKNFPNLHNPITVESSEEIIKINIMNSESNIQWQVYLKVIETKKIFMLYQAKALFFIIPKRAFSSNEQVDEFRELLHKNIEKFQQV